MALQRNKLERFLLESIFTLRVTPQEQLHSLSCNHKYLAR